MQTFRQKKFALLFITFCTLAILTLFSVLGPIIIRHVNGEPSQAQRPTYFNGSETFESTVVLISFDGLRSEYLDRGFTPTIEKLGYAGVRAEYMLPSFPSVTFPNHYTLVTGLYPESHGIVGNVFFDSKYNDTFIYTKPAQSWDSKWWGGEPIWITTVRQHQRSAVHMWPGCSTEIHSHRPTYVDEFDHTVEPPAKVDRILEWLDMPASERPTFIGAYVSDVDTAGHQFGPDSDEVNKSLSRIDSMVSSLLTGLTRRNLTEIVNLVIVSDHGMAQTSSQKLVYLDDLIDMSLLKGIYVHPLAGLVPKNPTDTQRIYKKLKRASRGEHWDVYLREDIPRRFHYSTNQRIPPIVCIPEVGWSFTTHKEYDPSNGPFHPFGMHGFDNLAPEMQASFVAHGPAFRKSYGKRIPGFPNVELYGILAKVLNLNPARNNGTEAWNGGVFPV
ncbi:Phosphodiest-domain-containing protein [Basidiobolus meristosporus CBS 931.73]|uniref:Phosphodiest-domain-containing protein n=1 Tax=Basidiobolus meristosporus CBS 931.73 TaxID=1314790 RepID=A0A1Y1YJ06_9FUNG|nr:Phosphodiest-domain-containing protein [Basidiobolus meristosporus CBS 931.73]|eukprot:ORX97843.1 Phosphodiest-domain-containing protein [Basidiobolus meristosporus CBS 931.73]